MMMLPEFPHTPSGSAEFMMLVRHHVPESLVSDGHLESQLLQHVIIDAPARSMCCCKSQKKNNVLRRSRDSPCPSVSCEALEIPNIRTGEKLIIIIASWRLISKANQ
jgi:hypothetical protein